MPYSSYRDRIGKLKYGVPNVCEIKTNLEQHVENIDNSFNSTLTLNNLIVGGGVKVGYISSTNMDGVLRYDSTERLQIYYNNRWNSTSGTGMWGIDSTNVIKITNDDEFVKPIYVNTLDISDNITLRNPQTSAPKFSINDLFGPLRTPILVEITNTTTSFKVKIDPIMQYMVGFQSGLLPEISYMEVKLENDDVTTDTINNIASSSNIILDSSFNSADIGNNWNDMRYLEFSKIVGTNSGQHNGFNIETYTFNYITGSNNLTAIRWDIDSSVTPNKYMRYKLSINYINHHPTENVKVIYDISLAEPPAPGIIYASTISLGNEYTYNTNTVSNNQGVNIFKLEWNRPPDNDSNAQILDYDISYSVAGISLNGRNFIGQYNTIEDIPDVTGTQNSGNYIREIDISNVYYGTKYNIQLRARNTTERQEDYSPANIFTMPFYTNLPPEPSNTSFSISNSWADNIDYDHSNVSSGYYKYNSAGSGSYTDETTSSRPKLINKNLLSGYPSNPIISDIIGLKIHTYATILPSTTTPWDISGVLQLNGVKHTSATSYTTAHSTDISRNIYGVTNYTSEGTVDQNKIIDFSSQIYDYYTSTSDIAENKNKFWMAMDISNIQLKLDDASRLDTGSISLYITDNTGVVYNGISDNFIVDDLNIAPQITNKSSSLKTTTDVEWNCGIASFKADNIFLFTFNVTNLASGTDGYFPYINGNIRKQIEISSSNTNNVIIEHDSSTYGVRGTKNVSDSSNNGVSIIYSNFDIGVDFNSGVTLIDDTNIGKTFNFTMYAYNIFGTTTTTITSPRILRDHASINNSLRSSRYIYTSGVPTPQSAFSSVDNQALGDNELLLWNGFFTGDKSNYLDFTQSGYNTGVTSSLSDLYSSNWGDGTTTQRRYALFKIPKGSISDSPSKIHITFDCGTSGNNKFEDTGGPSSVQTNFSLELWLPYDSGNEIVVNKWSNCNSALDSTTQTTSNPSIHSGREKTGKDTKINVSPLLGDATLTSITHLWLKVGLDPRSSSNALKFKNITLTHTA